MSGRGWKPGDVALVRLDADTEIRCIRGKRGLGWFSASGTLYDPALDARPLVVIDPEDRETVRAIADAAYPEGAGNTNRLQNALREFANPTPPKPEEPTGLGAVVEAIYDNQFVHVGDGAWVRIGDPCRLLFEWPDIAVVRVLSEGVTP